MDASLLALLALGWCAAAAGFRAPPGAAAGFVCHAAPPRPLAAPLMQEDGGYQLPGARKIEIEFIIYPDGRVEQRVLGAKGQECLDIVKNINAALGEVYETEATQEMFEQVEVVQEVIEEQKWGQIETKPPDEW